MREKILLVLVFWIWRVTSGDARGPRIFYIRRINKFLCVSFFNLLLSIVADLDALYAVWLVYSQIYTVADYPHHTLNGLRRPQC